MPRLLGSSPAYRKHKATGQAAVTLSGRDFYLGPWQSAASNAGYDRRVREWNASGGIRDVKATHQWLPQVPEARAAETRLLEHCRSELRAATDHTIEPPADWAREAKLGCKCADCQALSRFLRDPQARVRRFPIRKERRQHLHQQIDKHHCDCTHVTERKGSPQTLVGTKTQASYERRLQQYEVDQKLLAELDSLENYRETQKRPRQNPAGKR